MAEKNRRLMQGTDIIYPFTKQENVIGLQRTITDKLPIVSPTAPQSGFVPKQVWIDTSDSSNDQELDFGPQGNGPLSFGPNVEQEVNEDLSFGRIAEQEQALTFGVPSVEDNENQ